MKRILAALLLVAALTLSFAGSVFADPGKPVIDSITNTEE
jgi:uncharacterized membrane-anchored protein